jgi:SAM-dependent methyltransferase
VQENIEKFIAELRKNLDGRAFVKLTLGNYKGDEQHLQKILVRLIETKKGTRLFVQFRFDQRDVVKNFDFDEGVSVIRQYLLSGFRSAHLFTTRFDLQLDIGKKNSRLNKGKATFAAKPSVSHDREKEYPIDPSAFYLKALGITTDTAEIRAEQRYKWKQINKFVEILEGLYRQSGLKEKRSLKIVDMGSGKGYLTFAAYDYFKNTLGLDVHVTGIDTRSDLIDLCNQIATAGGFDDLTFATGSIDEFNARDVDILIALHACDTATDDALYKGVAANASIIVAAPCCHREVRRQMKPPEPLAPILKHSVMLERTAETITDGLRSLLLEYSGYSTKMFEFVATEHTPKNNMLVAVKKQRDTRTTPTDRQINEIRDTFAIKHQRLADLIGLEM